MEDIVSTLLILALSVSLFQIALWIASRDDRVSIDISFTLKASASRSSSKTAKRLRLRGKKPRPNGADRLRP